MVAVSRRIGLVTAWLTVVGWMLLSCGPDRPLVPVAARVSRLQHEPALRAAPPGFGLADTATVACRDSTPPYVDFNFKGSGTTDLSAFYRSALGAAGWRVADDPLRFSRSISTWEAEGILQGGDGGYILHVVVGGTEEGCPRH